MGDSKLPAGIVKRVSKKGKPLYYAVISYRDPASGKYKKRWLSARTIRDAQRKRTHEIDKINSGDFVVPSRLIFAEWLRSWLNSYGKTKLSVRSYERYQEIAEKHVIPALGAVKLQQLTLGHIDQYYQAKLAAGSKPATMELHHSVIHGSLKEAVKRQLIIRNPADNATLQHDIRYEIKFWQGPEIKRFLETAKGNKYYNLFVTVLYTGARKSELLGLQWRDIDFLGSTISIRRGLHRGNITKVPKTKTSERMIDISPELCHFLKRLYDIEKLEYLNQNKNFDLSNWVFHKPDGKPFNGNTVLWNWKAVAKKAGLKILTFHGARHCYASLMLPKGVSPKIVQQQLGHKSVEITLAIYSGIIPGLGKEAARKIDEGIGLKLVDDS